ncbi:MAG: hypothetical protein AB7R77_25860 [Ilumatobacteraceae bacterium]
MRATAQWYDAPRQPGRCVLVDIDGVLSDASQRQHYLNNAEGTRDWKGFFGAVGDDLPLPAVPALLGILDPTLTVVLLSARPSWVFATTVDWLHRHGMRWDLLILRGDDDVVHAAEFKRGVLFELREAGWEVVLAIDDDERIIDMYRDEQQAALYIHSGYYSGPTG